VPGVNGQRLHSGDGSFQAPAEFWTVASWGARWPLHHENKKPAAGRCGL